MASLSYICLILHLAYLNIYTNETKAQLNSFIEARQPRIAL